MFWHTAPVIDQYLGGTLMNNDYIYIIAVLLPIGAAMLVLQQSPYHALVIRGVLGAIAALVYTVLGAADVALTEALVGTLLGISLYAVAVRSSLVFRLGVLETELINVETMTNTETDISLKQLVNHLNQLFREYHLRVELVPFTNEQQLHQALTGKKVHAICINNSQSETNGINPHTSIHFQTPPYLTTTRLFHLYDIMNNGLLNSLTRLDYLGSCPDPEIKA